MTKIEYGKENAEVIILLHGGGLSWWNYREAAELLKEKYHVVIPILDGHAGSDRDFTSIESNASELVKYIDEIHGGFVRFIGGVSLGAQILIEMLAQRSNICQFALIESALVVPMKATYFLTKPMLDMSYGLIKKEWFSRLQFKSLKLKKDLYDDYYQDTCSITKENMIAFLHSNACYSLKPELKKSQAKVFIFVGQKELAKMIQSAHKLHQMIPNSNLHILKNLYHGEFSINHAAEYAAQVMDIIGERI